MGCRSRRHQPRPAAIRALGRASRLHDDLAVSISIPRRRFGDGGPVTLRVVSSEGSGGPREAVKRLTQEFEAKYPNVTVKLGFRGRRQLDQAGQAGRRERLGTESYVIFPVEASRLTSEAAAAADEATKDSRARFTARVEGRDRLAPGKPLEFAVRAETLHSFDPATGEVLR
jgi:hypothetical protein